MPVLRQNMVFEIAREIKAFFNLEAGITRGRTGELESVETKPPDQVWRQLEDKDREIAQLQARLAADANGAPNARLTPENIIWVFGVARTGSSWLTAMMADLRKHVRWNEPYVGDVFGFAYYNRAPAWQRERKQFILGDSYREAWLGSIRTFVLDGAGARFPEMPKGGYLVVKEPNGSIGAPLLVEALPESRVILLIRDPRDVAASLLAAQRKGSWGSENFRSDEGSLADKDPDEFVQQRAKMYMASLGKAKEAYETHKGHKVVVKYEDLRYDTFGELKRIYSTLGVAVEEEQLRQVVEKHAWENIPEEDKGTTKPRRKATPGGWQEDLTAEQARMVENITAPILNEFYSR